MSETTVEHGVEVFAEDLARRLGVSREPLHEQIATQIQRMILEKDLTPGSQLPSERDLAAALGISRVTLHQAMLLLEQRGLVSIRPGSGIFVT